MLFLEMYRMWVLEVFFIVLLIDIYGLLIIELMLIGKMCVID